MSELIEVTPSGTVGKQVFSSTRPTKLLSVTLSSPSGSTGKITVRDGNASGTVKLTINNTTLQPTVVFESSCHDGVRFDKGMHVKVLGTNALAYLEIN